MNPVSRTATAIPHRRFRPVAPPRPLADGLYPGEPETCRRSLRAFLPIAAHLGVLYAVTQVFHVEGRALRLVLMLTLVALPVHYLLPFRWKQPAALALSIVGLLAVFGPAIGGAAIALALGLVAATYLPWRWPARVALLAACAVAAGCARAGLVATPVPMATWTVLGTLVMFRLIILLYELKHAERPERPIDALSYIFLLPNAAFLHFPVVDYRTFRRGYFAADVHATLRRGLAMMTRGAAQLLLYRVVAYRLFVPAESVVDAATLAAHLVTNYLLYLHVSGQFHVACGVLHLYGYQLPETHHHYFLATGFTDYWRRINIYWKDFMVRLVFNPVVFRLKRRPQWQALALGTLAVFVTTWALHGYQAFWLRGSWGFSVPDALFWGILGALVLFNLQRDARRPPAARRARAAAGPKALVLRGLKVAGTFTALSLLWSLWSSPTLADWVDLLGRGLTF